MHTNVHLTLQRMHYSTNAGTSDLISHKSKFSFFDNTEINERIKI